MKHTTLAEWGPRLVLLEKQVRRLKVLLLVSIISGGMLLLLSLTYLKNTGSAWIGQDVIFENQTSHLHAKKTVEKMNHQR